MTVVGQRLREGVQLRHYAAIQARGDGDLTQGVTDIDEREPCSGCVFKRVPAGPLMIRYRELRDTRRGRAKDDSFNH